MAVEVAGLGRLGVHEQAPAANRGAELGGAGDHVGKEAGAQSSALVLAGDGEAGEQRDGLWVPAPTLAEAGRRVGDGDARHAPRVVGDDVRAVRLGRHEDPGRAAGVRLPGALLDPECLLDRPEVERIDPIRGFEQAAPGRSGSRGER